ALGILDHVPEHDGKRPKTVKNYFHNRDAPILVKLSIDWRDKPRKHFASDSIPLTLLISEARRSATRFSILRNGISMYEHKSSSFSSRPKPTKGNPSIAARTWPWKRIPATTSICPYTSAISALLALMRITEHSRLGQRDR